MRGKFTIAAALLLGACGSKQPADEAGNQATPIATEQPKQAKPAPTESTSKSSLPEPKRPIDPKSAEAAGQVVQHYGALIEQERWSEAEKLWGSADAAAQFDRPLRVSLVHLEIGDLGEPEGAAGSIYITMPIVITSSGGRGGPVRKEAEVTLRRVNDVPGSTEAQRRWHIERIDRKAR